MSQANSTGGAWMVYNSKPLIHPLIGYINPLNHGDQTQHTHTEGKRQRECALETAYRVQKERESKEEARTERGLTELIDLGFNLRTQFLCFNYLFGGKLYTLLSANQGLVDLILEDWSFKDVIATGYQYFTVLSLNFFEFQLFLHDFLLHFMHCKFI